jgi:SPP1 family predicted phage head-tail adaptor
MRRGKTDIGEKDERIVIESATRSVDGEGQPIPTWTTFATVWAFAEFDTGHELEQMDKINSQTALRLTVNYRTDIDVKMRVNWRSSYWNINAILPTDKFDMTLKCSKVE